MFLYNYERHNLLEIYFKLVGYRHQCFRGMTKFNGLKFIVCIKSNRCGSNWSWQNLVIWLTHGAYIFLVRILPCVFVLLPHMLLMCICICRQLYFCTFYVCTFFPDPGMSGATFIFHALPNGTL